VPVAEGRDFRPSDDKKAPLVAIVNRAFADRYFPGAAAIGKKIWFGSRTEQPNEIVGVVANSRTDDLTHAAEPEIYASLWQFGPFSKHLVVRTKADPRAMVAAITKELRAVDGTVAVEHAKTLEDIRGDSLASRTFAMDLLIGFSLVGSVLTLVGIYGVLSLSVVSRRREIAIRSAIGAQPGDIWKLVFGEGARLVAVGIGAGLLVAFGLAGVLRSFLYGVEPADPGTLISAAVLFGAVALAACWVPVRRATRVDPLHALRYD
jgi:putative ABC transport system permease protein